MRVPRRFRLATFIFAIAACVGCASTPSSERTGELLEADERADIFDRFPADLDLIARIPLDGLAKPAVRAVSRPQDLGPHLLENRPNADFETAGTSLDEEINELGSRLLFTLLLQGTPKREIPHALKEGIVDVETPVAPLKTDHLKGPAWIGYTVDERTRALYDWAEPGSLRPSSNKQWTPLVSARLVVPVDDAAGAAERLEMFCEDYDSVCRPVLDVRARNELLIVDLVPNISGDTTRREADRIDRIALSEYCIGNTDSGGLLDRLDLDEPTTALATFLADDGLGFYARTEGLRRIDVAERLAHLYEPDDHGASLTTAIQQLPPDVFAAPPPRRADAAVAADIDDEGLSVDTFFSHTEHESRSDWHTGPLPAPVVDDDLAVYGTWRFALSVPEGRNEDETTWEMPGHSTDDQFDWLQALIQMWMERPVGLDITAHSGSFELREFLEKLLDSLDVLHTLHRSSADYDRISRSILDDSTSSPEMLEPEHLPDSGAMLLVGQRPNRQFTTSANFPPAVALEFYYDEPPSNFDELTRRVERWHTRANTASFEASLSQPESGGSVRLRIGIGVAISDFTGETIDGSPGGTFSWSETEGQFRETLDTTFADKFPGLLPPATVDLRQWRTRAVTIQRFRIGSPDRTADERPDFVAAPPPKKTKPQDVPPPSTTESPPCSTSGRPDTSRHENRSPTGSRFQTPLENRMPPSTETSPPKASRTSSPNFGTARPSIQDSHTDTGRFPNQWEEWAE